MERASSEQLAQVRTKTLQSRLKRIEDSSRYLKEKFPDWKAWGSGYGPGNEPPAYYTEIHRLKKDREDILLELSKRVRPQTPSRSQNSDKSAKSAERKPTVKSQYQSGTARKAKFIGHLSDMADANKLEHQMNSLPP
ncbi:MAG: hypothetical protein WB630_10870, partial [Candidatus Acidiferrales bacterium]